jgi:hypothetical protein
MLGEGEKCQHLRDLRGGGALSKSHAGSEKVYVRPNESEG